MKKSRTKIPQKIADEVAYKSDMVCAVCETPGDHLHHIDGNPSNNDSDNLILLCFRHHSSASTKGNLSRKLSKGILMRYREQHYKRVAQKRYLPPIQKNSRVHKHITEGIFFQLTMDALVCMEVEKIRMNLRRHNWPLIQKHIYDLNAFPTEIGPRARNAILSALDDISSSTRHRMPLPVAQAIQHIASNILPERSRSTHKREKLNAIEKQMLHTGIAIGFDMAYDAVLYLRKIRIADEGAQILWQILSFANRNKVNDIKKFASSEFSRLEETAQKVGDKYSAMLFNLYHKHGLSGDYHFPDYPNELITKL
ncbi:MAG: HNH endonuclease [Ignavibacteriales bacterium]|nr:HNH endonuclease [Ignavibacteriales bacterium]